MNELMIINKEASITSLDVAELLGSRHDAVKRSIGRTSRSLELDGVKEKYLKNHLGQTITFYEFTDISSLMVVVARIRPEAMTHIAAYIEDRFSIHEALKDFDYSELRPDQKLYVIRNTETGNYKVGISSDPERRLKDLQTGNDCKLELIYTSNGGKTKRDERDQHLIDSANNIRGEWFTDTKLI